MEKSPRPVAIIGPDQTVICANLLTTPPPRLTPTGKISHAKTRVYTQRYRKEWEQMSDFKGWLTSVPCQPTRAYCLYCKKNLHAHRLSLLKHTCTMKHQRSALAHELEEKQARKAEAEAPEVALIEEVEIAVVNMEQEGEKEIEDSQSSEDSKSVIKKIKLMPEQKCRDPLAEAMAHVHNEYLEEEEDNIQMEMVVESANDDMPSLQIESDDIEKTPKLQEDEKLDIKINKNDKVLEDDIKDSLVVNSSLPVLNTSYQTSILTNTVPTQNAMSFVPITPNMKTSKTITLMCGNKTFTLTGGTFQPGTQYVLTKLKGKPGTVMLTDQKKVIPLNESDKTIIEPVVSDNNQSSTVPDTSQQSTVVNQQLPGPKSSKKNTVLGKQSIKTTPSKKLRISTYVVDNVKGLPISGLQVSLYKLMDGKWTFLNENNTNVDGHCNDLVEKVNGTIGRYKIHFDVDKYFTLKRVDTMFPFVEVVFDVRNTNAHYHIPLLLSPFGYTIYRGT
ncbi:LOW QUALITY PROTEIN: uncharacterized protein LOC105431545 [Pogonomyrmex barbatus]|uniref:hydroxyisourate hydrolase n=1 Tax=Pogonomyrmex barbatus TaxID=144034 RepID=A0A6I9WW28_9HYME|nr:LOW QUALITY PROTEIN: uncharacterized protein LOC105431545 [Pogonomyrmex barbatus]